MEIDEKHPVQLKGKWSGKVPKTITLRAYEVYKHVFGEQKSVITGNCRGGFSAGELIAYLYAYSFPKDQWNEKVSFALKNMENL